MYHLVSHTLIFRAHSSSRYSVAALAGVIETDPRLIDLSIKAPIEHSLKSIQKSTEWGPTILAHSVMSTQTERVYKEIRELRKSIGKSVTIIGGGAHASVRPSELLENGFDYVVVGEGEKTFPELLWHLINDKDPHEIQGVVSPYTKKCAVVDK